MFYADLHVHSKYSLATSRDGDLEHLAAWAARKGIAVLGTGDFTHPAWFAELEKKLTLAEPGLFRLRGKDSPPVRFMLQVEISTIYKRDGATRKVHHLVYAPDLAAARRIRRALAKIGNIESDGRPILGLDSRSLLEIVLEAGEGAFLIPAHVWTPWFSVLGSKSGFDSVEACYGDLSGQVFALETGLSADPAMCRRVSSLDRFTLVSNSDAHSPSKLGRETNRFNTAMDYFAMRRAMATGRGFSGTIEFFPEQGKYHYDGHRACGVCLDPVETRRLRGKCPKCGRPVTVGVLHRVEELADRKEPAGKMDYSCLVPLDEVLGEVHGVGPASKKVQKHYAELLDSIGPELFILETAPLADLAKAGGERLAEAIGRMRAGQTIREPGFDGQFGRISCLS